ncbi:pilus assembly protein PilP [Alteromonas sp. V450]|uniref:type 4a pilus biogenesis protein PilO n=1 Tax=Alteromonas sp. V450 TaxID=1912139 RepID=UPI0008FF6453|nr:type 4a pilus biogenesis protein PilO [Alteromonas sp. V450]OJF70225.1 pilus assembly protein PilP [Alteromonas sp. V450]|tara:strand:- start:664 stop:1272 length:609 start_codon:yes stop_codon:yes gene_type:complete
MKFDVTKLKELNELDFEQIAIWPNEIRIVVAIFVSIVVGALSYYSLVNPKLPVLESVQKKEGDLKLQFEAKYRIAANLKAYEEQLEQIKKDFSSMLRSLPTSNETPGLLDDITYVGTSAGLTFRLLNWEKEIPKEFYTELPIQMEVSGGYHSFGEFTSKIAALPRIVTLHDFEIERSNGELSLRLQAKTYRSENTSILTEGN